MEKTKAPEVRKLLSDLRSDMYAELDRRIGHIEQQLDTLTGEVEKHTELAPEQAQGYTEELDHLREDIAGMVSEEIDDYVLDEVTEVLEEHIDQQLMKQKRSMTQEIERFQGKIQQTTIVWSILVVMGGWMTWYGAWGIIGNAPLISEPLVSLLVGILLLAVTGAIHKKLIG